MAAETPIPAETRPLRIWGIRLLKGAVAGVAVYFTWRFLTHTGFEWSQLASRVAEARLGWVVLGVGLLLARYVLWDWRFRLAVRRTLGASSGAVLGFFVLLASAALNLITPTARVIGGMMRARYFARAFGRPFGLLYGIVLYDQTAHHAVMGVCTWITLIATAFVLGRPGIGGGALAALIASGVLLAVWIQRRGPDQENPLVRFMARRAERSEGRMGRFLAHGHEAVGVLVRLLRNGPHLQAAVLGTIYFLVNAAAQWALFVAIDAPVNPWVVVSVVALGTAVGTLTGMPGGLGTTELAMMASFKMLGVDEVVAAAGTLLYRGLHYATVLAVGLPALAVLEIRPE